MYNKSCKEREVWIMTSTKQKTRKRHMLTFVVKDNALIQKSCSRFSLVEQKAVAYICSMLNLRAKENGRYQMDYVFSMKDFCKKCGISSIGGKTYHEVQACISALASHNFWVLDNKNKQRKLVQWFEDAKILEGSSAIEVTISESIAEFLFGLRSNYTKYELENILNMDSGHSIRLYELLKSYSYRKQINITISELRNRTNTDNVYSEFSDFKRRVLDVAVREINDKTDLSVQYELVREGKKVESITFYLSSSASDSDVLIEDTVDGVVEP